MSANNDKKIRPFGTGWKEQGKKQAGAYGNSALQRNESNRSLEWENVFYDATGGRRNSNRSVQNSSTSNGNKSRSQHDAANRTFGHEQEYYDAPIKFSHPSNRSFCANEAPYFHPTGNGYNKVQRARVTSNTSTNSGTCRDELSGSLGGGRTTKSSRINSATSNGNLMFHGYSGDQHEYSKASGEPIHSTYVNRNGGNRTKSDSSSYPAPDVNYIKNFVSQNAVKSIGSYQKQKAVNESAGEHRGRDNQRRSRNASARSAVGAGNKTFNGYELQLDKSFLETDSMMCDEVFDDNTTLDTTGRQDRLNYCTRSSHDRSSSCRTNKSFLSLDGSHKKDYILLTHRPARKSDDLHCARPPLPRGDEKVDSNKTFSAIRYGSSQANVTIKGGTRKEDIIPLKFRPGGVIPQKNEGRQSQLKPRFGHKSFDKHKNYHVNGLDTARCAQVLVSKFNISGGCSTSNDELKSTSVTKQINSVAMQTADGNQISGHQQEGSGDPGDVIGYENTANATGDGKVKRTASRVEQVISGYIQTQDDSQDNASRLYNPTALKLNQTFGGFDSSFSVFTKTKEQDLDISHDKENSLTEVKGDYDLEKDLQRTVNAELTGGCVMEAPTNRTLEIGNKNTAIVVSSNPWTHFRKMKVFACDVFPIDGTAGIYICTGGSVLEMPPYVVVAENYIMFYGKDEEQQKMPPKFEFELVPLVEPHDNRIVAGVYNFLPADHYVYPSVMELIELGSSYSSRDLMDYEADRLNKASTSTASDPTNNE
ncbi:hypothetical protein GCK72_026040 [Caenorhabditis remanei]|uniref:Uncharacterized protein n=1 Tax=Caenorhabditis remanei TaxID=31234 RepID=A0A6A5G4F4_CAERE|nr:hypothetical protein GCK72_026040 [Caenorhabditis remanei]KAF1749572.1 hypothetical protein GCK72_026040 [Caenorhabditis remanei]